MDRIARLALKAGSVARVVAVDANFLVAWVSPGTSADDRARIEYLLETTEKAKGRFLIPMPAMAEYLVRADTAGLETMNRLERKSCVQLAPFDRAAAFECAQLDRAALGGGDKRDGVDEPWQKIKIDRQIIAIAKAYGATLVVSGDDGIRKNALRVGMQAVTLQELPLPESVRQRVLDLPADPGKPRGR